MKLQKLSWNSTPGADNMVREGRDDCPGLFNTSFHYLCNLMIVLMMLTVDTKHPSGNGVYKHRSPLKGKKNTNYY
jgi:hypothetical protein